MTQPSDHRSSFVPSVGFQETIESSTTLPYIKELAGRLLEVKEGISDIEQAHRVPQKEVITEVDWASRNEERKIPFQYVYEVVMADAQKRDGRIYQTAYAPTFDQDLTPQQCEMTGIHYGTMTLAGEPILYYVRFDLADLIAQVRREHEPTE